jgi:hypothetical protein
MIAVFQMAAKAQYDDVLAQANHLDSNGKYTEEVSLLENYVDTDPMERYAEPAALKAGGVATNHKDYRAAYRMYSRAWVLEGKHPKLDTVVAVAQSAAFIGDKSTSISFYKIAITLATKSDPNASKQFQNEIIYLESNP